MHEKLQSGKFPPVIVTISWDDADPADLIVALILEDRCLRGTFYVPIAGYHGNST
jgi:hypothetical protein